VCLRSASPGIYLTITTKKRTLSVHDLLKNCGTFGGSHELILLKKLNSVSDMHCNVLDLKTFSLSIIYCIFKKEKFLFHFFLKKNKILAVV